MKLVNQVQILMEAVNVYFSTLEKGMNLLLPTLHSFTSYRDKMFHYWYTTVVNRQKTVSDWAYSFRKNDFSALIFQTVAVKQLLPPLSTLTGPNNTLQMLDWLMLWIQWKSLNFVIDFNNFIKLHHINSNILKLLVLVIF